MKLLKLKRRDERRLLKKEPRTDGSIAGIVYHLVNVVGNSIHESFSILILNGIKFEIENLILSKGSLKKEILKRRSLVL